eukprot:TRINITY_DN8385_c0_g2_i1.p1 TRINITY_DN8385_c0_g2~~TRINITY_DN8385_c0_g2_i1.p1  ORF type:complete len:480 (-),score=58.07 TRINITY_DN8385_c0_g2_i1:76-1515(-)
MGFFSLVLNNSEEAPLLPWYHILLVYIGYTMILVVSYFWEYLDKLLGKKIYSVPPGYSPLLKEFDSFYTRRIFNRINDCWDRAVYSAPGSWINVSARTDANAPVSKRRCLNLGSYNYLGFAGPESQTITDVKETMKKFGLSSCSPSCDIGHTVVHEELEKLLAQFLGKEACMILGMGFATNSTTIPALVGAGDLIISDSLNHASTVFGCRSSGARVKIFKHNNMDSLETVIRDAIVYGQPRTHRPWNKILIVVEGVYSMEGEVCKLREIVALKKKYKCYLYVDEAHSIGALGKTGRGVCEHAGVSFDDIDILMGTFTKSFASVGGYLASSKEVVNQIRQHSYGTIYEPSMAVPSLQQALSALKIITTTELGAQRLKALKENSNFFRKALKDRGFQVFGDEDSPVIPIMLYHASKIAYFSRECFKRNLAVVVVGFPATPLLMSRARVCISASHTREDLEWAIKEIDEVGLKSCLKYGKSE